MDEPPRLPEGSFAAWNRDRLALARRGAVECGNVWPLEPNVYVAATASPCGEVLHRSQNFPKPPSPLFPPLKRAGGAPTPEERTHARAARIGETPSHFAGVGSGHPSLRTGVVPA
ncbi:hypothetical protein [Streptomyces sp. NPDC005989]|uniref:hypothetical protein n=1 Tax=Streptomyces sp. NPDC005989 TaxID=3156727 RepID=UPI0033D66DA7